MNSLKVNKFHHFEFPHFFLGKCRLPEIWELQAKFDGKNSGNEGGIVCLHFDSLKIVGELVKNLGNLTVLFPLVDIFSFQQKFPRVIVTQDLQLKEAGRELT